MARGSLHLLAAFLLNLSMLTHGIRQYRTARGVDFYIRDNEELSEAVASLSIKMNDQNEILSNLRASLEESKRLPQNCAFTQKEGANNIQLEEQSQPFKVYCDQKSAGGGWTMVLIQSNATRRSVKDFRDGYHDHDFFMGVDKLYALVHSRAHEVLFNVHFNNWTQIEVQAPGFLIDDPLVYNKYVDKSLSESQNMSDWLRSLQKNVECMKYYKICPCHMPHHCELYKFPYDKLRCGFVH